MLASKHIMSLSGNFWHMVLHFTCPSSAKQLKFVMQHISTAIFFCPISVARDVMQRVQVVERVFRLRRFLIKKIKPEISYLESINKLSAPEGSDRASYKYFKKLSFAMDL